MKKAIAKWLRVISGAFGSITLCWFSVVKPEPHLANLFRFLSGFFFVIATLSLLSKDAAKSWRKQYETWPIIPLWFDVATYLPMAPLSRRTEGG